MQELKTNLLQLFDGLKFSEADHVYSLNGRRLDSVTQTIERFKTPFDKDTQARKTAAKTGRPVSEVLAQWDEASRKALATGNRVHQFAENFPQLGIPSCGREAAVLQWYSDQHQWSHVANEIQVFSEALGVAGTIDCLMYDKESDCLIVNDWKTNKYIGENEKAWNQLNAPFDDLGQTSLNIYTLQVNLYAVILGLAGFGGVQMYITHLPPGGGYVMFKAADCRRRIYEELIK